jgi:hypothetical protein
LRLYSRAEAVESILRYHSRVVEPLPVGLYAGNGRLAVLEDGSLGDVSFGIALGFTVSEALEQLDLLGVTEQQSVYLCTIVDPGAKRVRDIPVEVCALGLDIAHAIARLSLALLAVELFLLDTHGDCFL